MTAALATATGAEAPTGSRLGRVTPSLTLLLGLAGVLGFAALLEVLPRVGVVDPRFFPPFSDMVAALGELAGTAAFWTALGDTLTGWSIGLAIAASAAVVTGILIGSQAWLRSLTASTVEFLRPIPSVALIPLAVLLYGTGMQATLLLVVYASFWQMFVQVLYGVQDVDPVARDTARSFRFGPARRVRSVLWPTALPYVMTGFRLAAAVALVLEVSGELIIGTPGLGKQLAAAQTAGDVDTLYAIVIVTGALGIIVNLGARAIERRALRWHPSQRLEAL